MSIASPDYGIGFVDQPPAQFTDTASQRALVFQADDEESSRSSGRAKAVPFVEALQMKAASAPHQFEIGQLSSSSDIGLPEGLKYGIEALSGVSLDGVNVHYNSPRPARFNALACTQGRDIHVAPGQEQYVPHEAWHVTQQAQGRVLPTMHTKDGLPVNYSQRLEHEADVMGARAALEGRVAPPSRFSRELVAQAHSGSSQRCLGTKTLSAPPRQSAAGDTVASSFSGGCFTAFAGNPPQVARSDTGSSGLGTSARFGVIQLGGFGAETTYGMELEFTNRWLTPLPKGKNAARLELEEGVAFQDPVKSPKMTVTGDDGRGGNTVLEIESRVFERQDWQTNKVHENVEVILARAPDIIKHYREKQPALLEEERQAAGGALGRPVSVDVLDQAESLAMELESLPALDEVTEELLTALQPIAKGVGEESRATLQVTTLGRKGKEHSQALAETSADITELNKSQKGEKFDFINPLQAEANEEARELIELLNPNGDPEVLEDFRVTLETAVKIVMFSEKGISGYGTVKNMPYVLPRRIINPPLDGFVAALGMDISNYEYVISDLKERLAQTDEAEDSTANDILLMLSRGMNKQASQSYANRVMEWEQRERLWEGYDPRFSLWTVEGGVPTLESDIIKRAGKKDPANWTAHELRHFGWAMGMTAGELKPYLDLLKKQATKR